MVARYNPRRSDVRFKNWKEITAFSNPYKTRTSASQSDESEIMKEVAKIDSSICLNKKLNFICIFTQKNEIFGTKMTCLNEWAKKLARNKQSTNIGVGCTNKDQSQTW